MSGSGTVSIPDLPEAHAATLRFETRGGKLHHAGESRWPATVTIPNVKEDHAARLRIGTADAELRHSGENGPWPGPSPRYTVTCPDYSLPMRLMGAFGFFVTDGDKDEFAPDGQSFSGEHATGALPGTRTQHIYSFRCRSGC
ncbi:MAG TPA: hypothetical protein VMP00_15120 [Burkholderiales bacterium]|nr:hypothetical protein [Burkholderiales bacterium]